MTTIDISSLNLIDWSERGILETIFNTKVSFRQRKSYEEYYVEVTSFEEDVTLSQLQHLAEWFDVTVEPNKVVISCV